VLSVADVSSTTATSALTIHPGVDFVFAEAPVFTEAVGG